MTTHPLPPAAIAAATIAAQTISSIDFGTYRLVRFVLLAISITVAILVWRRSKGRRNR